MVLVDKGKLETVRKACMQYICGTEATYINSELGQALDRLNPTPADDILAVLKDCANFYVCIVCGRAHYQHNTNCALDAAIKKLEGKI